MALNISTMVPVSKFSLIKSTYYSLLALTLYISTNEALPVPVKMLKSTTTTSSSSCNPAPFNSDTAIYSSLSEELELAIGAARALSAGCQEAKDTYINEGFLTREKALYLDGLNSSLPQLPSRSSEAANANVANILRFGTTKLTLIHKCITIIRTHESFSDITLTAIDSSLELANTQVSTLLCTLDASYSALERMMNEEERAVEEELMLKDLHDLEEQLGDMESRDISQWRLQEVSIIGYRTMNLIQDLMASFVDFLSPEIERLRSQNN